MTFTKWLQSRLTAHGFPCGPIDGIMGPNTEAALRAFQTSKFVTGTATEATVAALRLSSTSDVPLLPERNLPYDPAEDLTPPIWPRQNDVSSFFGEVGERQTKVEIPWDMYFSWNADHRISGITLHEKVADSARLVLERVAKIYSAQEIRALGLHLFGGSLNVRRMRGGTRYSMHSWGIAIDFDPQRNQLRWKAPRPRLSHEDAVPFWEEWEREGWVSLGRTRDFDWMHVQAARL